MRPKRRLGQNFLVGAGYPERIVAAVSPGADEPIIEIGPGEGALTALLLARGARVTAIEIDDHLIPGLHRLFGNNPRFALVNGDALDIDFCRIFPQEGKVRVVANLPYYISTPLLQRLIAHRHCISEMTLMLQREVVDRIIADPGGRDYGYLTVLVSFYCEASRLFDVPPGAFRPVPKVTSSVVRLRPLANPAVAVRDEDLFLSLTRTLFAQRRKTIHNNLRAGAAALGLGTTADLPAVLSSAGAGIDGHRRAETLSLRDLASLAEAIHQRGQTDE